MVVTFYPKNALKFDPPQYLVSMSVNCRWLSPPGASDVAAGLTVQLNALSKKAWVQAVLVPDFSLTGGGGPLLYDYQLQVWPTVSQDPYMGGVAPGTSVTDAVYLNAFGQIPQGVMTASDFYGGLKYVEIGLGDARAFWAVYDPANPGPPVWFKEAQLSAAKYAEVPFSPMAANVDLYGGMAYSRLKLSAGRVRFEWGAAVELAYVQGATVFIGPDIFSDGTGETNNLVDQVTVDENAAVQISSPPP